MHIPIPTLYEVESNPPKDSLFGWRTALHSGKLGDIIYSLPTVRNLMVNHLILNLTYLQNDPLRTMTEKAARSIIPFLLNQSYLRKVSIVHCNLPFEQLTARIPEIDFNLDNFRKVARHRVENNLYGLDPLITQFSTDQTPVHLAQMFAASQGIEVDIREPWCEATSDPRSQGKVVVSVTHRWRSYPNAYWKYLLSGLGEFLFVGSESEWNEIKLSNGIFVRTRDALQLASLISGCKIFLGTISFAYSLAEALKVPRMVELCFENLNAFPMGSDGYVLPTDLYQARQILETHFDQNKSQYVSSSKKMKRSFIFQWVRLTIALGIKTKYHLRRKQRAFGCLLRKLLHYFRSHRERVM